MPTNGNADSGSVNNLTDVFIIMPFHNNFNKVYECVQEATGCARKGLKVARLDNRKDQAAGVIHSRLEESLRKCRMCIADITGRNANVMWEAGFAAALRKPVLFITQEDFKDAPFDIAPHFQIQYDANNLNAAFSTTVTTTVQNTLDRAAGWQSVDADPGFLKSCLMSVGSPVYLLDMRVHERQNGHPGWIEYQMRHMNEAGRIFQVHPPQYIGRPLGEFLDDVAPRLKNLAKITERMKRQEAMIIDCCEKREYSKIPGTHVEDVILNHDEYGEIKLLKVATAVRDSLDEVPRGWVVTFNVKEIVKPEDIKAFYAQIKGAVEALPL